MITIDDIMYRIYRNPLLQNVRKVDIVEDIKTVLKLLDVPVHLEEKRIILNVQEYRVKTPKDLHQVKSVMAMNVAGYQKRLRVSSDVRVEHQGKYRDSFMSTATYKVVPGWLYTDFKSGDIEVIYTGFTLDASGYPLIPNNESLLLAIEGYVKVNYFTMLVELGHMNMAILERAEQQYNWYIGQASNSMDMPTAEETESLFNALIRLIPDRTSFETNDKFRSNKEILKNHD